MSDHEADKTTGPSPILRFNARTPGWQAFFGEYIQKTLNPEHGLVNLSPFGGVAKGRLVYFKKHLPFILAPLRACGSWQNLSHNIQELIVEKVVEIQCGLVQTNPKGNLRCNLLLSHLRGILSTLNAFRNVSASPSLP